MSIKPSKSKRGALAVLLLGLVAVVAAPVLYITGVDLSNFRVEPVSAGTYTEENIRLFGFGGAPAGGYNYTPKFVPGEIHSFSYNGRERSWHGYVPETVGDDAAVIVLLHGSGRTGTAMIDMWKSLASAEGLLLIAPNSIDRSGWNWLSDGPDFLTSVIADAKTRYGFDDQKIFLFGHSAGAIFAHMLANRTDGPWRAASAHAGFLAERDIRRTGGSIPLQIILGEEDHIFPTSAAKVSAQAFADFGHDTVFVSIAGHTHWYYADAQQINKKAWAFFLGVLESQVLQ